MGESEKPPHSSVKQPSQSTSNFLWCDWSIAVVITGKCSELCATPVGKCVFVCTYLTIWVRAFPNNFDPYLFPHFLAYLSHLIYSDLILMLHIDSTHKMQFWNNSFLNIRKAASIFGPARPTFCVCTLVCMCTVVLNLCLHILLIAVCKCPCYSVLCFHTCVSTLLKCELVCFVSLLLKAGAPLPLLCRPHRDRFLCPPQPCPSNVIMRAAPLDSTNQSTEPFILPLGSAGRS